MAPPKTASVPEPKTVRQTRFEDLKATELFHDAPEAIIQGVRRTSRICSLKPNQRLYIIRKNQRGNVRYEFIYIILKGYVALWIPSCFDPTQEVFLGWRGPQQILGEMRIPGEQSRTRINTCDECEFIELTLASFRRFADKDSSLYRNVANLLLRKMSYEGHRSEVVQMTSVTRKVAQSLIHLAEDRCEHFSENDVELEIPGVMRQGEIAAYAGIPRRETVNKELNELSEQGLIGFTPKKKGEIGSRIIILNLPALRKIVETKRRNDPPATSTASK